jgi:CRP-like cAMP-binding protein
MLERMLDKFARRAPLSESDRQALLALPYQQQSREAGRYIVREGETPTQCVLILSGLAYRHKITVEGTRQIVSVHIPGDFVDLEGALLNVSDHNVQALTRCELALVPKAALQQLLLEHPQVARAMWIDTLIDGSIYREWVLNVGRRNAPARLAHLLCEFARRLEAAGMAEDGGYELPMTQEQLADALGLTPVHVNRTLKALEQDGLLRREKRFVSFPNKQRLRETAGFNELYLHLDQVAPELV